MIKTIFPSVFSAPVKRLPPSGAPSSPCSPGVPVLREGPVPGAGGPRDDNAITLVIPTRNLTAENEERGPV